MSLSHYFIAVSLKHDIKEKLSIWQKDLRKHLSYKQWPHMEDLHVTLKFLGPVSTEQLEKLSERLYELESIPSFELEIHGLHHFGNPKQPRVLFADVLKSKPMEQLQKKTETIAESCGFQKEKRVFKPHITLAKRWNGTPLKNDEITSLKEQYTNKKMYMQADEVVLYEIFPSKLPKYVPQSSYQLR